MYAVDMSTFKAYTCFEREIHVMGEYMFRKTKLLTFKTIML